MKILDAGLAIVAYFSALGLLITYFGDDGNIQSEEIPIDQDMVCFDSSNTTYQSVCYRLEKVNVTMDSDGSIDAKPVGSTYKEKQVP